MPTSTLLRAAAAITVAASATLTLLPPASAGTSTTVAARRNVFNAAVTASRHVGQHQRSARFMVRSVEGATTVTNAAQARAFCTRCQATSLALQVALVGRARTTQVRANNRAWATNRRCEGCASGAYAYQFVVVSGDRLWLTASGSAQLGALHHQLNAVVVGGTTPAAIEAASWPLVLQVLAVLQAEVRTGERPVGQGLSQSAGGGSDAPGGFTVQFRHQRSRR